MNGAKKLNLGGFLQKKITKLNSKVSFAKRNIAWLHYFPKTILKIFCFDKKKFQIEIWKDQFLKKKYRQTLIEKGTADFLKKTFIMSDIFFIESSKNAKTLL